MKITHVPKIIGTNEDIKRFCKQLESEVQSLKPKEMPFKYNIGDIIDYDGQVFCNPHCDWSYTSTCIHSQKNSTILKREYSSKNGYNWYLATNCSNWIAEDAITKVHSKVEEVPQYVKCIKSREPQNFTVGKIYHIPGLQFTSDRGFIYSIPRSINEFYPHVFSWEPSTKEAFDKQSNQIIPEIGKWYEILAFSDGIPYTVQYGEKQWGHCKYTHSSSTRIGIGGFTSVEILKEVSSPEVKEEEVWEPKIGDWVVITKSTKNWGSGMDALVGKCVKIIGNSYGSISFEGCSIYSWVYSDGHFRKATGAEVLEAEQKLGRIDEPKMSTKTGIDLKNTKIWIGDNPELSRKVQEKLFQLGYTWSGSGHQTLNEEKNALYIDDDSKLGFGENKEFFKSFKYKEITPQDLGIGSFVNEKAFTPSFTYDKWGAAMPLDVEEQLQQLVISKNTIDSYVQKVRGIQTELKTKKSKILF